MPLLKAVSYTYTHNLTFPTGIESALCLLPSQANAHDVIFVLFWKSSVVNVSLPVNVVRA
jgi:phenolic acid decarboxylase